MKVIFELPFKSTLSKELTQFKWLNNANNWLFILEDGKKIRTISVDSTPPREIQYSNLAEKRLCTCFSWNFDGTQLALVIDESQIYLWDVKSNHFNHFKPTPRDSSSGGYSVGSTKRRSNAIALIGWSMVSNKLAICSSGGQLTLCNFTDPSNVIENFIDNGSGVLRRVAKLESSLHLDMFACITIISEVLVMTFDGEAKFYIQAENLMFVNARFSLPNENLVINEFGEAVNCVINHQIRAQRLLDQKSSSVSSSSKRFQNVASGLVQQRHNNTHMKPVSFVWVSYQSKGGKIFFKRIVSNYENPAALSEAEICFDGFNNHQQIAITNSAQSSYQPTPSPEDNHRSSVSSSNTQQRAIGAESCMIDHYWIAHNRLICCDSIGMIGLLEIKHNSQMGIYTPVVQLLLNIRSEASTSPRQSRAWSPFRAYDFRIQPKSVQKHLSKKQANKNNQTDSVTDITQPEVDVSSRTLSIAAISSTEIFYYELIAYDDNDDNSRLSSFQNRENHYRGYSLERVDDIDLSINLEKFQLQLEQVAWCYDCSMLAVQLTGGYILAYRTILQNYMLTTCGPKTAQLSTPNEITILDFQIHQDFGNQALSLRTSSAASSSNQSVKSSENASTSVHLQAQSVSGPNKALVVNANMKPSMIFIGPLHLAVSLNNRIRLYSIVDENQQLLDEAILVSELDYTSIVVQIGLSSHFMASLFHDGRLKLSSIGSSLTGSSRLIDSRERTFPDPSERFERISGFTLTEQAFIYCSELTMKLFVFSLDQWNIVQTLDHSKIINRPIYRLRSNEQGNKFVCLTKNMPYDSISSYKVFLYDMNSNRLIAMDQQNRLSLFDRIVENQRKVISQINGLGDKNRLTSKWKTTSQQSSVTKFGRITDALWDSDGRSLILIESCALHNIAILEHTLEPSNQTCNITIEHFASLIKRQNNQPVYLSQGIVSYQTKLGRMINSILSSHDDDLRLTRLEKQIDEIRMVLQGLKSRFDSDRNDAVDIEDHDALEGQATDDTRPVEESTSDNNEQQRISLTMIDSKLWSEANMEVLRLKESYLLSILPIYSINRCKCILEHLATDDQFNLSSSIDESTNHDDNPVDYDFNNSKYLWCILASWAIYTMNLNFALMIYRKSGLMSHARLLTNLMKEQRGLDSIQAMRSRLLEDLLQFSPNK